MSLTDDLPGRNAEGLPLRDEIPNPETGIGIGASEDPTRSNSRRIPSKNPGARLEAPIALRMNIRRNMEKRSTADLMPTPQTCRTAQHRHRQIDRPPARLR
jgi:hypothetical protein